MKSFIKKLLREQLIDGENMNPQLQSLCDTISVNSYDEVISRVTAAIGSQNESPELWAKIQQPLSMLKQANAQINGEKHTNMLGNHISEPYGATGDCMADEADTYWAEIQSTLCEQGPEFQ
jgi:hypothetical protein